MVSLSAGDEAAPARHVVTRFGAIVAKCFVEALALTIGMSNAPSAIATGTVTIYAAREAALWLTLRPNVGGPGRPTR